MFPPVLLIHDAPGSGWALEPIARILAKALYVILPDLPGNGESDAPPSEIPILEASKNAILTIADALHLASFSVAAVGCGAAVASALANTLDPRLEHLILEGIPQLDPRVSANIAPELELSDDGSHWVRAWLIVRDGEIWSPWFDGRIGTQRPAQGRFDADWLHRQTFEIMKARKSYFRLPRAAFAHNSFSGLQKMGSAVRLATRGTHPLHSNDTAVLAACPEATAHDCEFTELILKTVRGVTN